MSWEAILTLAVLGAVVIALAWPRMPPDLPLVGGLAILAVTGCAPLDKVFTGFANPGLIAVAALYVVAAGLQHTGAVSTPARWLFGHTRRLWIAQLRIMFPAAAVSAFINNTPVVAALLPVVLDWGKRHRFAASRLAMPLSFAAILGGSCTLIGTSTTIIVNGLLTSATNGHGMGFFTIGAVGLPVAISGFLYILLFGRRLLPDRQGAIGEFTNPREYTVEMLVSKGSPLAGQTLEDAGLRHLPGLYVVEIERAGHLIPAPGPRELLEEQDRLVLAGIVESVADLQKMRGLVPATGQVFKLDTPRPDRRLIEAVIAPENPMVGRTVREGRFRSRYGAVVIAVARAGRRVTGKIGAITLAAGDTLLIEAPGEFLRRYRHNRDFLLLRPLEGSVQPHYERAWIAWLILGAVIGLVTTRIVPLAPAAVLAAVAMVGTRCINLSAARRSIELQVILVIGSAFGTPAPLRPTPAPGPTAPPTPPPGRVRGGRSPREEPQEGGGPAPRVAWLLRVDDADAGGNPQDSPRPGPLASDGWITGGLIAVPSDIEQLRASNPDLLDAWRLAVRAAFQRAFAPGLTAVDLRRDLHPDVCAYVLRPS